jgi:hypothetical protein
MAATGVDRSYVERNHAAAERLERTLAGIGPIEADAVADGGWTVSALLAHLAFWDRYVLVRWQAREPGALAPLDVPAHVADLVNDAAMPGWAHLSWPAVQELVRRAARETDAFLAGLPDEAVAAVIAEGRPRLVDRSLHRAEHIATIERTIGRMPSR